jgi:hypothetical protein
VPDALLVEGDVLLELDEDGDVLLPDADEVSPALLLELPVVPEVELPEPYELPLDEPIIALVSV